MELHAAVMIMPSDAPNSQPEAKSVIVDKILAGIY